MNKILSDSSFGRKNLLKRSQVLSYEGPKCRGFSKKRGVSDLRNTGTSEYRVGPESDPEENDMIVQYRLLKSSFERLNNMLKATQEEAAQTEIDLTTQLNEATER